MTLFEWKQENSVGVVEIDNQHKHIFELINRLYDSISNQKTYEEIDKVLSELVDYSKTHFKVEEDYFNQFNYINKDEHVVLHHYYIAKVATFIIEKYSEKTKFALSLEVIDFLEDWWINHINFEDKKYTETFHQHGVF